MKRYKRIVLLMVTIFLVGSTSSESQERTIHAHEGMVESFNVEIWVDRGEASVYYPGERLRVYFRPSHDCYVVVYSIDTEGYIRVLYPYGYDDDPFVYAGRTRRIPDAWDHHDLLVSGPSGIEHIVAVASLYPIRIPHWGRYYDSRYVPPPDLIDHITGDPYEGMLHLTDLVLAPEYRDYGYVTNSTYFYVERRVWYPRYMCYDCHWPRPAYFHPYADVCIGFEIVIVDYDWYDDWAYWRPHHPPVRYRRGCWTVRRRDRSMTSIYSNERYSRRRGSKNIGFSKTDVKPVNRQEVRRELEEKSKIERRRGTEPSPPSPRSMDTYKRDDRTLEKRKIEQRDRPTPRSEDHRDRTMYPEQKPEKKSPSRDVKQKTEETSKTKRNLWDKISDWSKQNKSTPSVSKTKPTSTERKASKPSKVSTPSKSKSTSKTTPQKKTSSGKKKKD